VEKKVNKDEASGAQDSSAWTEKDAITYKFEATRFSV